MAAEEYIYINDGQNSRENTDVPWVWVERGQNKPSAALTLNGGNVTGSKLRTSDGPENHLSTYLSGTSYPKKTNYPNNMDLDGISQAEVAVFVHRKGSVLSATNVSFTGEVAVNGAMGEDDIEGETKITIKGGWQHNCWQILL